MTETAPDRQCIHCYISGLVQGVFFRSSTRQRALALKLAGYARNLADGRVEVMACGEVNALNTLRKWLQAGPPQARVVSVECEPHQFILHREFSIK
jgi:acylphosphatase